MHAFAAVQRRPRIVYGRKKAQRSHKLAAVDSSEDDLSDMRTVGSLQTDSESDAEAVESILAKENVNPQLKTAQMKGKGRSKPSRQPMRPRANGVIDLTSDDTGDEDDSVGDAIRSPHRRRRQSNAPRVTLIEDDPDSDGGDSQASGSNVDLNALSEKIDRGLHLTEQSVVQPVRDLLEACRQESIDNFDESLDRIQASAKGQSWHKIGEATFSEVFAITGSEIVVKVIPLLDGELKGGSKYPERSVVTDVDREVRMTGALHQADGTFVKLHSAYVVRGPYPRRLLQAWDERKPAKGDQNRRPDVFPSDQTYCLLTLTNAGSDLETFNVTDWRQAASMFVQVCRALAKAEVAYKFEHRDLHWGNVVIASCPRASQRATSESVLSSRQSGVRATIIDFTLSRALLPGADSVSAHPFDDPAFFKGKGEIQFDVYRDMRRVSKSNWAGFYPYTNVLWLRYLVAKLIDDKGLVAPTAESKDVVEKACFALLRNVRATMDEEMGKTSNERTMTSARTSYKAITILFRSTKTRVLS